MAQQVNVALNFSANTQQAKTALQDLQTHLTKIAYGTDININPGQMQQASSAAKELAFHLNQAYNSTTGNFDLTRLNNSLKSAGTNVTQLSSQLLSAGQSGQQAFVKLAQTISMAEAPVLRVSNLVSRMATTFGNTLRYQLAASAISGFTSAISGAVNYAQDLNESLNNIRIVTGYGSESMNKFAIEANKAAKALNTTTTEYTNASLIFYQQGLTGEAVKERADVVIKLANVTGQAAETVSDQMTAIWNNFDDGSKSIEYYADVITKLGAATASSTDEISDGLEKFAAVAETVGLSYEMATSALATVTAETRQSADVVGTAFKTIFSRMEGLKLGDSLEDGTDLNQYSAALMTVGVSIKDQRGQLKEMDTILQEIGAKWTTLSKDQQIALAQSVAGVRQYNQFIALMGNWEKVQENYDLAVNSAGELNVQAEIYAESWEAARDRVTASLESIYSNVLKDDFFIGFLDGISTITDAFSSFIDGVGGIGPIIMGLGSILLGTFANKVPVALANLKNNFMITFGQGAKVIEQMNIKTQELIDQELNHNTAGREYNLLQRQQLINAGQLSNAKSQLALRENELSSAEKRKYEFEIQGLQLQHQDLEVQASKLMALEESIKSFEEIADLEKTILNLTSSQEKKEIRAAEIRRKALDDYVREKEIIGGNQGYLEKTSLRGTQQAALARREAKLAELQKKPKKERTDLDNQEIKRLIQDIQARKKKIEALNQEIQAYEKTKEKVISTNKEYQLQGQISERQSEITNGLANKITMLATTYAKTSEEQQKNASVTTELSELFIFEQNQIQGVINSFGSGGEALRIFTTEAASLGNVLSQTFTVGQQEALAIREALIKLNDPEATPIEQKQALEELLKKLKEAKLSVGDLNNFMKQSGFESKGLEDYQHQLEELEKEQEDFINNQKRMEVAANSLNFDHVITQSEAFASAMSGLGSAVFAIQSIKSAIDTLKDPDMSGMEKLLSVLMSITMAYPMITSATRAFSTITKFGAQNALASAIAIETENKATKEKTQTEAASTIITRQAAQEKLKNAKAAYVKALAEKNNKQALVETARENLKAAMAAEAKAMADLQAAGSSTVNKEAEEEKAKATLVAATEARIAAEAKLKEAEADLLQAGTAETNAASELKEAGSQVVTGSGGSASTKIFANFKNSLKGVGGILKVIWPALIGVGIAIGGIALAVNLYNKKKKEAEKANKVAAAAKEQLDETKQAYEDFKSTMSSYDEGVTGLEKLKKGTLEYQEALMKANDAALELINSNNLIYGTDYTIDESGLIQILEGTDAQGNLIGKTKAQQEQLRRMQQMQAHSNMATQEARDRNLDYQVESFNREYANEQGWSNEDAQWLGGGAGAGAAAGAGIGATAVLLGASGPVGWIIAGVIAAIGITAGIIGAVTGGDSDDEETQALKDLQAAYEAKGDAALTKEQIRATLELGGYSKSLIDSLVNNAEETQKMVKAMAENTEMLKANIKASVAGANAMNQDYQALSASDQELANEIIARDKTEDIVDENSALYQEAYDYFDDKFSGMDEDAAQAIGQQIYGNDYGTKYRYTDLGGTDWTLQKYNEEDKVWEVVGPEDDITQESLIREAARLRAMGYDDSMDKEIEQINKVADILTSVGGDEAATRDVQIALASGNDVDLSYLTPEQRNTLVDQAEQLGQELGAKQYNSLIKALNNYSLEEHYAKLKEQADAILTSGAAELEMDKQALEAYAEHLVKTNSALKGNVKLAAESAVASAKMTKGLDKLEETLSENIGTLREADKTSLDYFESLGAIQKAVEKLFGVEVSSEFITNNIDLIDQAAQGSIEAFEKLRKGVTGEFMAEFIVTANLDEGVSGQQIMNQWQELSKKMDDIKVGVALSGEDEFVTGLNELISKSNMTKDQVNEMLSGMGFSATFSSKPEKVYKQAPSTSTIHRTFGSDYDGPDDTDYTIIETVETTPGELIEENVDVFAMETAPPDEQVVPKITSMTKSAPPLDTSTRTNTARDKTARTNKRKKAKDEDVERYYKTNQTLGFMEKQLDAIATKKDIAFGSDRIALMRQEHDLMKSMIPVQMEYFEQAKQYLTKDANNLIQYGIEFDENGMITNYEEITRKYRDKVLETEDEEAKELAEEQFDNFKEDLELYEQTYEEFYEAQNKYNEMQNNLMQQATDIFLESLEQRTKAFERANDKLDRELKYLEYKLEDLEDLEYAGAQAAVLLGESLEKSLQQNEGYQKEYLAAMKAYEDIKDGYDEYGNAVTYEAIETAYDQMLEAGDRMLEGAQDLKEYEDKLDELLFDHLEEQDEKFSKVADELEHYNGVLEQYANILDLTGKKIQSNEVLLQIADAQVENARVQTELAKAKFDTLSQELAAAQATGASEEVIQDLTERVREAQTEMLDAFAAGLQAAADKYTLTIEKAAEETERALLANSKYDTLEEAQQAFDQQQELNKLYVEEYDKLYKLNKLTRDINKSMSENNSLLANRKLSSLLDEINEKRESGVEMSEYELDALQRKYNLRLAEIALEEAQNAKSSMRLMRDTQGNWNYVYTANQEKIDEAQQQYEDALYEIEQASREYLDEMQAAILQNQRDMIEAIKNLRVEDFASVEEYEQAVEQIRRYYTEKNTYYYSQIEEALGDINYAYGEQIIVFKNLAIAEVQGIRDIESGIKTFNTNVSNYLNIAKNSFKIYYEDQEELTNKIGLNLTGLANEINIKVGEMTTATGTLSNTLTNLSNSATKGFNGILSAIQKIKEDYFDEIQDMIDETNRLYEEMLKVELVDNTSVDLGTDANAESAMPFNHSGGYTFEEAMADDDFDDKTRENPGIKIEKVPTSPIVAFDKSTDYQKYSKYGKLAFLGENGNWYLKTTENSIKTGYGGQIDTQTAQLLGKKDVPEKGPEYANEMLFPNKYSFMISDFSGSYTYWIDDNVGSATRRTSLFSSESYGSGIDLYSFRYVYNPDTNKSEWHYQIDPNRNIYVPESKIQALVMQGYDTGGYTGEWGPEGKLAILHEKELILNKDQTSDFLNSLEVMSHIVDVIDRNSMLAAAGLAIDKASAAAITERVIQQTVSIEANFPGVTSAIEIEEALNNIVNDAVQYANIFEQ